MTLNLIDFQPATEHSPYEQIREAAYGQWLDVVKRTGDFTGVQIYRQVRLPGDGNALPSPAPMPFINPSNPMDAMARPEALQNGVEYVYAQTRKPVFVTENGIETDNDERRAWYIRSALEGLYRAINAGTPVLGYLHWSLLDNFEWLRGYAPHFGLVGVDRSTFKRTPKASSKVLGTFARQNGL